MHPAPAPAPAPDIALPTAGQLRIQIQAPVSDTVHAPNQTQDPDLDKAG